MHNSIQASLVGVGGGWIAPIDSAAAADSSAIVGCVQVKHFKAKSAYAVGKPGDVAAIQKVCVIDPFGVRRCHLLSVDRSNRSTPTPLAEHQ